MSTGTFEQSQTNLQLRLKDRWDVRRIASSSTLTDVDCGKFLSIILNANMTITLPSASLCVGGEFRGMVTDAGSGLNSLTFSGGSGQIINGQGGVASYINVPRGFSFVLTSTGKNWCLLIGENTTLSTAFMTRDISTQNTIFARRVITSENIFATGIIETTGNRIVIGPQNMQTDTALVLDGVDPLNDRYITYQQNGNTKLTVGLSKNNYYFVFDSVNNRELITLRPGIGNDRVSFPSYTTDGDVKFIGGNGTLQSSSDRRLKKGEEALSPVDSLQKIMGLQPKKYIWKSDQTNRVKIGFIAQDVETAIPEAVDGKKYEFEFVRDGASQGVQGTVRVDQEGNPVLNYDQPRYRGLDQGAILSTLVAAFQELVQRNVVLENRIKALESA